MVVILPINGVNTEEREEKPVAAQNPVVFSKEFTGELDCVGLLMVADDTYGIIPAGGVEGVEVSPDYTKGPLAVGCKNHIKNGKTVFEARYLGAGGVLEIKTDEAITAGSVVEADYTTGKVKVVGDDWAIGVALTSTTSSGGTLKVATCVPE